MASERLAVVFTNAVEGREDDFGKWYDNEHIPDLLDVPGVKAAQRFEITGDRPEGLAQRFMVVYELDRPWSEVMAELGARMADGRTAVSDTLDASSAMITEWVACDERQVEA